MTIPLSRVLRGIFIYSVAYWELKFSFLNFDLSSDYRRKKNHPKHPLLVIQLLIMQFISYILR
jgi:hypothetical protein